jgi:DedD protein
MGLLSIFKRDRSDASVPSEPAHTVQQARTRARRRLMGASLLVLMGIVGFPLLFESQPRPISVDIPIDIPRPEGAPALKIPPARSQIMVVEPPVSASASAVVKPAPEDLGRQDDSGASGSNKSSAALPADSPKPTVVDPSLAEQTKQRAPAAVASAPAAKPSSAREPSALPRSSGAADAARAQAALEGRDSPASKAAPDAPGRFVVQVGAFADAAAAKEVRQKIEKLGLKTYVQTVDTSSGRRIRVRIGPLESKEQAAKVAERLKSSGLTSVVLSL